MYTLKRRTLFTTAPLALAATATAGGCGAGAAAGAVVANPVAESLLLGVASSLLADVAMSIGRNAKTKTEKVWDQKFNASWAATSGDRKCFYFSNSYVAPGAHPFMLTEYAMTSDATVLERGCFMSINSKGKDGVALPTWAYQTLAAFMTYYLPEDMDGVRRSERSALMALSLSPNTGKSKRAASDAGAVKFISYGTSRGPVDILLFEQEDHGYSGRIKVSGLPDVGNKPVIWECEIPSASAVEQATLKVYKAA